ncbi:DNA-binding protein [Actinomadura luteofluorescens]|uniref:DNA-binding protein n=1 Tax=Actinomadura luteofluorescens TaxID=46163 RepID=UPI0036396194
MSVAEDTIVRNRALQTEWYGEPLGERVRPLLDRLGMSQSGLAGVLGLSAPMLSQLMSGQRAKISNPAVLHRLMAVEDLVAGPGFDALSPAGIQARLEEIKADSAATTSGMRGAVSGRVPAAPRRRAARARRSARAGAPRPSGAARPGPAARGGVRCRDRGGRRADRGRFPDLAEVLRVYGASRTSEAEAHFARTVLKEPAAEDGRGDRAVMP